MLKMVDGTGIIGVDMVCPLGATVSPPQPPNYDNIEMEGIGSLMLPNSLKAPLERLELIGNSMQGENPSPDNPQEIKNAGRKSKNLFNIADLRVGQVQKDGTINEKSTFYRTVILDVPEDGKYRITFNSNNDYTLLYFAEAYINGEYLQPYVRVYAGNSDSLISLKKGKNILSFSTHKNNTQIDFTTDHNIMIAAESETTAYEPYGHLLDLKVTGKNLLPYSIGEKIESFLGGNTAEFEKDGVKISLKSVSATSDSDIYFFGSRYVDSDDGYSDKVKAGDYTFLSNSKLCKLFVVARRNGTNTILVNGSENQMTHFTVLEGDKIRLFFRTKGINGTEKVQIMLCKRTDVNLPYEPYAEQSLTITSDRPLTKWDKLVEQGGQIGWLYQSAIDSDVKPSRVDLFPNGFSLFKDFDNGVHVYKVTNIKKAIGFQTSLCEQFKNKDGSYSTGDLFCYSDQPSMQMQYFVTDIPSLEEFKTWMEANPLTMVYKTTQTEFIPLSESEQTQLRNLHSYNGTTNIIIDSGEVPCGINVTYRKEK